MTYLKTLGLAAVLAAALTALLGVGSASATVFCSATETPCAAGQKWPNKTVSDWTLKTGTSAVLTIGTEVDKCTASTIAPEISNPGSATETVKAAVGAFDLTWGVKACTLETSTLQGGEFEIHLINSSEHGTITASAFVITVNTKLLGSCTFTAGKETDIGIVTGSKTSVMDINGVFEKVAGMCTNSMKYVAEYSMVTPAPGGQLTPLFVEPS